MNVLVLSANYGAGHVRAAEAVIAALRYQEQTVKVTHLDFSAVLGKPLNTVVKNTYIEMIKHTPKLWGEFYYRTAQIEPDSLFQRFLNGLGRREFVKLIYSYHPDVIISTYPTIAGVIAQLRSKRILQVPLVTVVTDYAVHSQWIHPGVDLYIVGCQDVYDGLVARGINPNRVKVTGIPVHPRFDQPLDRATMIKEMGLRPDWPIFLVMGGAYGVLGGAKKICHILANTATPVQALVVCGKDKKMYKSLDGLVAGTRNPIKRFGFVTNIEELMTVADVIVTKAGGLTVSEALTKGLPLVIHKPIPGQEQENANFIRKIGAGTVSCTIEELQNNFANMLENPEWLAKMRLAAQNATPGHSAQRAVDNIFILLDRVTKTEKTG